MPQCHIPEDLNFQQQCYEYLKSWNLNNSLEIITLGYVTRKYCYLLVVGCCTGWLGKTSHTDLNRHAAEHHMLPMEV